MIPKIVHNIWIQGYDQLPENIKKRYEDIKNLTLTGNLFYGTTLKLKIY